YGQAPCNTWTGLRCSPCTATPGLATATCTGSRIGTRRKRVSCLASVAQYSQTANEESPYFTELKGQLMAEPEWLLQPRVTLQLNRRRTTTKKLVLNFSAFISKQIDSWEEKEASRYSWAMIQRAGPGRIQAVLEGSDARLECKVIGSGGEKIEWMLPDLSLLNNSHPRLMSYESGILVINKVTLSDSGLYHCLLRTDNDIDVVSFRLTVRELLLSPESLNGQVMSVESGKPLLLPCSVSSVQPMEIIWYLPRNQILKPLPPNGRTYVLSNGTLVISKASHEDAGEYSCLASNLYGVDMLSHLVVITGDKDSEPLNDFSVYLGRPITLDCVAVGKPQAQVSWILPDRTFLRDLLSNGTLRIQAANFSSKGNYKCIASNAAGADTLTYNINVAALPPAIEEEASESTVLQTGGNIYLHCTAKGEPPPTLKWSLPKGIQIKPSQVLGGRLFVFPNGTLYMTSTTSSDSGRYECSAVNAVGMAKRVVQLDIVQGAFSPRQHQVDCVASGLPDPEVSWSLPDGTTIGNALQSDDSGVRSRRYVIFGNGTLLLRQMEKADEGNYTCYAKNELGEDEMRVNVRVVQDSLRILSKNQVSVKGRLGEPAYMKCDTSGDLPPTIIWLSPNNNVIASSSNRYQILEDGTLVIRKVGVDDQGKYACVSRNSAGDEIKNVKLEVEAQEPQIGGKGGKTSMKVLAVSYQTKLLHCKAEGMPNPRITWTTPQGISMLAPYHGGRFQVHQNGSLELRGLRKTDEGRFVCQAKNDLGEASLEMELEVASLAEKPSFAMPNIEVLPLKVDAHEITLECLARGKPMPEFVWLLPNGTVLNPGDRLERFLHHPSNGTLRILRPVMGDKGAYRCLAKNVAGQGEKRYSLEPGKKPQIRGAPGPMKISFGQNLRLPCLVDAWPQATITWTLPSGLTLNKPQVIGKVTYLSNGTLQVKDTTMFDRGTYSCKVTNTFGSSVLSYPVAVMVYPPRITSAPPSITRVARGSPVTLTCTATGTPKPEISWTLPGRTTLVPSNRFATQGSIHMTMEGNLVIQNPVLMNSGIYKCNAKNALGTDFKATYLQVI
uniref:Si:ch211-159i8.4 n=1 Tax=Scleropages formosus TaxID=113540 RepID=A0A8C9VL90_SCLFO